MTNLHTNLQIELTITKLHTSMYMYHNFKSHNQQARNFKGQAGHLALQRSAKRIMILATRLTEYHADYYV